MALIRAWGGKTPRLADSVWVADGAVIIGDVEIGPESSVWFGAVVRGDVNHIRVGARTNLQDYSVLHVTSGTHPTIVGDDVTLGHRATLHGCTVKDRCLVGIGATDEFHQSFVPGRNADVADWMADTLGAAAGAAIGALVATVALRPPG
ncbi:MAG: VanZ family protein, partial [Deltaproteobacteria bacterium]|nr:VanZ family protein [Deltaproteobacteria bacterium]